MGGLLSIATDAVATFRTEWAERFVDACQILDPLNDTDRGTMDPITYQYDEQTAGVVYTGACLIRPSGNSVPAAVVYGQEARTFIPVDIYLPHDAAVVDLDQQVVITASVTDTQLVGKVFIIRAIVRDSYNTRRKLQTELDLGTGIAF